MSGLRREFFRRLAWLILKAVLYGSVLFGLLPFTLLSRKFQL